MPERVAMRLTGHKTRWVFERYNIVSDGDLGLAATRIEQVAPVVELAADDADTPRLDTLATLAARESVSRNPLGRFLGDL